MLNVQFDITILLSAQLWLSGYIIITETEVARHECNGREIRFPALVLTWVVLL